jgi:hypothetical protein
MKFRYRKSRKFGPLKFNFTEKGFSSWGINIGRWTWNSRTKKHTVNTPGPGYVESGGR